MTSAMRGTVGGAAAAAGRSHRHRPSEQSRLLDDAAFPVCGLACLEDVAVGLPALANTDGSHEYPSILGSV